MPWRWEISSNFNWKKFENVDVPILFGQIWYISIRNTILLSSEQDKVVLLLDYFRKGSILKKQLLLFKIQYAKDPSTSQTFCYKFNKKNLSEISSIFVTCSRIWLLVSEGHTRKASWLMIPEVLNKWDWLILIL